MAELTRGAFLPPPPVQNKVRQDPVQNRVNSVTVHLYLTHIFVYLGRALGGEVGNNTVFFYWHMFNKDQWYCIDIFSKYSSRPTTITSNLSEVEMNICIIVYLAFE